MLSAVGDAGYGPDALGSAFDCSRGCFEVEPRSYREIRQISDLDWIL